MNGSIKGIANSVVGREIKIMSKIMMKSKCVQLR